MPTYLEDYQEHLERVFAAGGDAAAVDAAVDEYNAIGLPSWNGSTAFDAWLAKETHTCAECLKEFSVDPTKVTVSPREAKQCQVCLPGPHGKPDGTGEDLARDA